MSSVAITRELHVRPLKQTELLVQPR